MECTGNIMLRDMMVSGINLRRRSRVPPGGCSGEDRVGSRNPGTLGRFSRDRLTAEPAGRADASPVGREEKRGLGDDPWVLAWAPGRPAAQLTGAMLLWN